MSDGCAGPVGDGLLEVARWSATYLVPRHHPAPERVRARLDPVIREALPRELGLVLGSVASGDDVWLIRRLHVDLSVSLGWQRGELAKACGTSVARSIVRTLGNGADGGNIRHYDDRAAYLAAFLLAVAENNAWGKWQFAPYERLRILSLSRGLLAAITETPDVGLAALRRLRPFDRDRVIGALSPGDAQIALDTVSAGQPETAGGLEAVWSAWRAMADAGRRPGDDWRGVLGLFLESCGPSEVEAGRTLAAVCRGLLRLIDGLGSWTPEAADRVVQALGEGRVAALHMAVGTEAAEILHPLIGSAHTTLRDVARAVRTNSFGAEQASTDQARRWTTFGGAFLLLSNLADLDLASIAETCPALGLNSPLDILRLAAAAVCFGERQLTALADPVLRDLFAVGPEASASAIIDWFDEWPEEICRRANAIAAPPGSAELTFFLPFAEAAAPGRLALAGLSHALLRDFARRLPGFAGSSPAYLVRNFLDARASVEEQADRRIVRLGRPPLGLILDLTGIARSSYTLPWGDGRPIYVYPEDSSDGT
jgi:hypothetical protein